PAAFVVHGDQHLARLASQLGLKLSLHTAQSIVIQTNIAQHLCSKLAFGIEAFGLFLEVNTLQVQRTDTSAGGVIDFARNPGKSMRGTHPALNLTRVGV